ncbi:MAG: trimethylamine methyltransferase family protein [Deltaproteobacteria bacterium]|nr:trimethylamine methyltransferase family protein [Deltaproteobacteria bacterium]
MRVNYTENVTPRFQVLSEDQIEEIISGSLEILERVGVKIHDEETVELLKGGGAQTGDGILVKIPSFMVKKALNTAPGRIVLARRDGKRSVVLEKDRIHFGTGSDCPFFIDPDTGRRRKTVFGDVVNAARVADALPNIDFFMSLGLVSDVPSRSYDRHQFLAMATGTTKPLVITAVDGRGLIDQFEMASVIVGGEENFRQNPLFAIYAEPSSPLVHSREAVEKVTIAAERDIPIVYVPAPSAGGTAPVTLAGLLVEGLADTLTGLVVSQLRKAGAPFVMGGVFTALDMRTTVFSYGAPELLLLDAALTDISKRLGIPVFSTAGCSDAKTLDEQAGLEAGLSILMAAQSGANLIHDVGYLESGLLGSLDMLVLADEAISMVKRILNGISVNQDTLALDVISRVGPGGHFLDDDHTISHFKEEIWMPRLIDRSNLEDWDKAGRKTMAERVRDRVHQILETHQAPPMEEEKVRELKAIIARADRKYA